MAGAIETLGRWVRRLWARPWALSAEDTADRYAEDFGEADIGCQIIRDFYRYWCGLAGKREMPETVDIDAVRIPRHLLPSICMVDALADGRFRYRVAGTQLVEGCGVEITGKYADEMPGSDDLQRRFQRLVQSRRPYHCIAPLTWSPLSYKTYETVVCPLADPASGQVVRLIGAGRFG